MIFRIPSLLYIDPRHELIFEGPFVEPVKSILTLTNPCDKMVGFKMEFTVRKRYGVKPIYGSKPIYGKVNPKDGVTITVKMLPFDYAANKTDTFELIIQSFVFNIFTDFPADGTYLQWNDIEDCRKMESKLECVFVMPSVEQAESEKYSETELQNATTQEKDLTDKKDEFKQNILILKAASDISSDTDFQHASTKIKNIPDEQDQLIQKSLILKKEILRLQEENKIRKLKNRAADDTQHLDMQNRNANSTIDMVFFLLFFLIVLISFVVQVFYNNPFM